MKDYSATTGTAIADEGAWTDQRPMTDDQVATMFAKVGRLGYTQRDLPAFTSGVVCAEVHHKIIKSKT